MKKQIPLLIMCTLITQSGVYAQENNNTKITISARSDHDYSTPTPKRASLAQRVCSAAIIGALSGGTCYLVEKAISGGEINLLFWFMAATARSTIAEQTKKELDPQSDSSLIGNIAWFADWIIYCSLRCV